MDVDELAGPYTAPAAVNTELAQLAELRSVHRHSRWVVTELWIVTVGMLVVLAVTRWWLLALPVVAFTLLAVHLMDVRDVSAVRGRELDQAVRDAQRRLHVARKEGR